MSSVERRGKAIRYHGDLEFSRSVEDSFERLNVDYAATRGFRVRMSIWSDGVCWLGITKPGPRRTGGWEYCESFYSHLESVSEEGVVERFEQTIHSPAEASTFWPLSDNET